MPDNEESRKSVAGVVTPNAAPDADWRREVAGVFVFAEEPTSHAADQPAAQSATLPAAFSASSPPLLAME